MEGGSSEATKTDRNKGNDIHRSAKLKEDEKKPRDAAGGEMETGNGAGQGKDRRPT